VCFYRIKESVKYNTVGRAKIEFYTIGISLEIFSVSKHMKK
jgi:hypothetical protein